MSAVFTAVYYMYILYYVRVYSYFLKQSTNLFIDTKESLFVVPAEQDISSRTSESQDHKAARYISV